MVDQSKMANINISTILLKRGNTTAANTYVGPLGELLIDTGEKTIRIQDGATPGGMSTLANTQQLANLAATVANLSITAGAYGNANVATYLPVYGGTIGTNLINFTNSNAQINSQQTPGVPNTSSITMTANILHDYSGFYAAENAATQVYSAQDIQFYANTTGPALEWVFGADGNTTLPSTNGRILFPYNENSNAIIDNSQDVGQFFILQNNLADGYQNINLDTDDALVRISSKNAGGYPLRTWSFDWQGQLTFPDATIQSTAYQGPAGQTSFATVANVTTANVALKAYVDNKIGLLANAPAILDTLGQIATAIQTDEANIGTLLTNLTTTNANIVAANSAIVTANTAMKGYVDAVTTAWTANAATQLSQITAANSAISTLQANLGSYYFWNNANAVGLYNSITSASTSIQTISANIGSFYTYANLNYGTSSYANANVAAYLLANPQAGMYSNTNVSAYLSGNITTGNINVGSIFQLHTADNSLNTTNGSSINVNTRLNVNGSAVGYGMVVANPILASGGLTVSGNSNATSFYGTNYYWANGVSLLSGIGGTYSNSNVASYLLGNITTGNVGLSIGSWLDFRTTDQNWRIGYGLGAYTKTTAQATIDVVVGQGQAGPDGFSVGQTGGTSIFELVGYTKNAWFANNVTVVGNVTSGNVLASGFFYANGTPFTSSSYGNTQVAAYLVANPQSGTYSNTNVSAYLTSATITTTGNITASNIVTTGALQGGSGTQGIALQPWTGGGSYAALYSTAITPANGNYSILVNGTSTWLNAGSGGSLFFRINNQTAPTAFTINASQATIGSIGTANSSAVNTQTLVVAGGGLGVTGSSYFSNTLGVGGNLILSNTSYVTSTTGSNGNITLDPDGTGQVSVVGSLTATGNITAGNLTTSGTYTVANITTTGAYGNITGANVISANTLQVSNGIFWANGVAWSSSGGTTYSNANIVANLANFVTNISTSANITTTANMIAPNYLFANGVNILSTVTGGSGTYSNTNVAAYLTANPISSIANGGSSVAFASSGGNGVVQIGGVSTAIFSQSQLNVTGNIIASANIQAANIIATQYGNSVGTTASYSGNVTAAYFTGNGVGLTGITYNQIGNIYGSSSNVTLQAGSYSWTFDNTGNLTIPTTSNIVYANGTVFTSGTGGGGTTYSNANVVTMLAANTAVFIGNTGVIGNVATGNIQANATAIFLGANTVISNYGSPTFGYSTHIGNNIYFDANGVQRYRNTQTGAADLIVAPGTLNFYATGTAVTANTATGYTGATSLYMALSTSGMSLYNNAGLVSSGPVTIQSASGLVTNQATIAVFNGVGSTINMGGVATTITLGQSTPGTSSNVFVGNTVGTQTGNLTLRARGQYNYLTAFGTAGGYNSPPYNNQTLTGGSGTGMIASYTTAGNGYVTFPITIVNPGTGYKNGDVVTLPGGLGSTAQIWNYNSNYVAQTGQSDLTLTIDGNLILPGGLSLPANSVVTGDFSNSTFNYRTVFRTTTANATTGIYAVPSGTGTGAAWQAANSSNIANTSKIMITTNGSTDVQLVSGINGTGTYLPLSFLTNGSTQMQLGTAGNLLMVTGGNISTTGNVIAGNIVANQYGNSIGTTATYSGNVTASSVIASGSSGPQTRFLWDTWQTNSNVGLAAFTPSGTVGGNATWDSNQAYGLKLTTNTTSQSGYINWNSNTVNYNYDMVITASVGAGEGTGADGQWIYFGANAAVSGNPGNTNSMGGIAVMNHFYSSTSQFEVYVNGTQTNIPYIGNTYTPSGITVWNGAYFNFYNLTLKIRKIQNGNRMLEIYLNEAYQGSVNIGSWTPAGNNFGVAAYTGGSTAYQWVRQLRIDW